METLTSFLVRNPKVAVRHPQLIDRYPDISYSYKRKDFPRWYLTAAQYTALFRKGHPQKQPVACAYSPTRQDIMLLFDCRTELEELLSDVG